MFENLNPLVPKLVKEARMDTCRECEHFNADYDLCRVCGCYMPLKTTLAMMHCPIHIWPKYVAPSE